MKKVLSAFLSLFRLSTIALSVIIMEPRFLIAGDRTNMIFPIPQEMKLLNGNYTFNKSSIILIPENASSEDRSLARLLVKEMSDNYGFALTIKEVSEDPYPIEHSIIMGSIKNPLIKNFCNENNITLDEQSPGAEGYQLSIQSNSIVVAGWDAPGAFYGLQSLRQIIRKTDGKIQAPCLQVRDWPLMPFRAIRMYIPGPENISFFNRFISDFMALYKFNKVILEVNCMRLDRHPEVNAGWIEFSRYMHYTRTSETLGPRGEIKNSGHQDAGDGYILEKDDVRRIADFANENFIEVIPEIPSLAHGYYLLTRHPELAEYPGDLWPDTYCPSNAKSYELMFDVFDEYIEVLQPNMIHIGHDEWRGAPLNICPLCKGKDYSDLYASDINKIHRYLTDKGIKIAMWGDHMLESVRGKGPHNRITESGVKYQTAGGLRPSVVESSIPKDILIFNWFWKDQYKDAELQDFGFQQVYGNFKPNISDWDTRIKKIDVMGGAPSSWTSTNEFTIGKDLILDYLGCANLLWSSHTLDQEDLGKIVRNMTSAVRRNLSGKTPPSEEGDPIKSLDISNQFNLLSKSNVYDIDFTGLKDGEVLSGSKTYNIDNNDSGKCGIIVGSQGSNENPLPSEVKVIEINEDVSSLLFLHACAKPAGNQKSYFSIFNTFDSSDLLGWYQVVYEDGFIEIIPIQYGVNILEWNPGGAKSFDSAEGDTGSPQKAYCYAADAVDCSIDSSKNTLTFYAFEWTNTRFGKKIKEISISGSSHYQSLQPEYSHAVTKPMDSNAIMLIGISKVVKRSAQ